MLNGMLETIFLFAVFSISAEALTCFNCRGISHPRFCDQVTECTGDEVCALERQAKSNGDVTYNIGCISSKLCQGQSSHIFGLQPCISCCSADLCNSKGCGENALSTHNGTICYECTGKLVNEQCNHVTFCETFQICYIEEKTHFGEIFYNSGCRAKHSCSSHYSSQSIFGRRDVRQRRSVVKTACCGTSVCNDVTYLNGSTSMTTRSLLSTTPAGFPTECADINSNTDGVYTIKPKCSLVEVSVYCIMRANEKWTVIQRRIDAKVDFYRNWADYKTGFGSKSGDYWLGNDNIHLISTNGDHELSVYIADSSRVRHAYANYSHFAIAGEGDYYRLNVTGYSGNAGDSLKVHNHWRFGTYDVDHDDSSANCADYNHGAWWYKSCHDSNLNGKFGLSGNTGAVWRGWTSSFSALGETTMMIKRKK